MNTVQSLQEQKAALEREIAEAVKQANERKKALEIEISREREAEIKRGAQEVRKIMQSYNLSQQELVIALADQKQGKDKDLGSGMLSELRRYYSREVDPNKK